MTFRAPTLDYSGTNLIGAKYNIIGQPGNFGTVYRFNGHALKIVQADSFNGDEIRVLEKVAKLEVGPQYFGAWVTEKNNELFVMMEMEELANVLGKRIPCGMRTKDLVELIEIQNLFKNRSDGNTYFFDRLFSMLKTLADNNISYSDPHYGNIIYPQFPSRKHVNLIDFGSAFVHKTPQEAALATINAPYVNEWIEMFENLPSYAEKGSKAINALKELRSLACPH